MMLFYYRHVFSIVPYYNLSSICMKQNHKRKTLNFDTPTLPLQKRKHHSTATLLREDQSRLAVFDLIEHLLAIVFEKENVRACYVTETAKKLRDFEAYDALYFNLDFQEEKEVMCKEDAQPLHQENRSLEVVKTQLKKSSRRLNEEQDISEANESRMSVLDVDRRDRENIIQKLKKEYSLILQSKYLSESTPIGESRTFFAETDTPEITTMRKNHGKPVGKKQAPHGKASFIEEEIRRKHKLNTMFKRSKDFVEIIDPTMTNSMYVSQMEPQTASQRSSFALPAEPQVVVKLSKFKEISNCVKTKQELASENILPASPAGNNTKLINLIAQQEREALKQRVERSFHSNQRMKFREVSETERKPRLNNAISVSFLPRIGRV